MSQSDDSPAGQRHFAQAVLQLKYDVFYGEGVYKVEKDPYSLNLLVIKNGKIKGALDPWQWRKYEVRE